MISSSNVRVDGLVVRYGPTVALAASTFDLRSGTITALIGANGSGKTTLLHALAGVVEPAAGSIEGNVNVASALVSQQHHHHRWMPLTVAEVVRMGRYRRLGLLRRFGPDDRAAVAVGRPAAARPNRPGTRRRTGRPAARRADHGPRPAEPAPHPRHHASGTPARNDRRLLHPSSRRGRHRRPSAGARWAGAGRRSAR